MGAETPAPGAALLEMDDPRRGRLVIRSGETVVLLGPSGDGRLVAQAPLAELFDSTDPDIRAVLAWVTAHEKRARVPTRRGEALPGASPF